MTQDTDTPDDEAPPEVHVPDIPLPAEEQPPAITILTARDLVFANAEGTRIDALVTFSHIPGEHPFTCDAATGEPHMLDFMARATAGEFGAIAPYVAPPPPAPVLPDISDRQFYQALATPPYAAVTGVTMAEAKAAVKVGQLPAAIQAVVDAIEDPDERDRADMLLSGATVFQRSHPEVGRFAAALGWNAEQVDAFWLFAASL